MRVDDRIQRVRISQGFGWLIESARLIQRGQSGLISVGALWLLISMVAVIPFVGQLVLAVITPLLTAGVLVAFDQVSAGKTISSATLLSAWHRPRVRPVLLVLGLWTILGAMVALSVLASWLTQQISEAELQAALAAPENLGAMIERLQPGQGLYLAGLIMILVLMGLYFAIPLAVFGEVSAWTAVRASLKAIFFNLGAFVAYVFTLLMVVGAFVMVLVSGIDLVTRLPSVIGVMLAQIMVLVLSMALQILLAGAQYVAFCQIFGWSATPNTLTGGEDHSSVGDSDDELSL